MPSGNVHALIGVGVGAGVVIKDHALMPTTQHLAVVTGVVGVAALGALLPDVDLQQSTLGRYVPWVRSLLVLRRWLGARGPIHRGLTHRVRWVPVVCLLVALPASHWLQWSIALTLGASCSLGFLSHLVADRPMGFWRQV